VKLTDEQENAATADGSVAVTAGAGTGKTHMLAERYLYHLKKGLSPLEIVAVTFTEQAAMELRARIRGRVAERLPGDEDMLAHLEAAQISTVHALAARVCRDHAEAAEVPPDFRILDELEGLVVKSRWLEEALDLLPREVYEQAPYSLIRDVVESFFNDPITAAKALKHDSREWPRLITEARARALSNLLSSPSWGEAVGTLRSLKGKQGDKMEDARLVALGAVREIEQGAAPREHLEAIQGIKLVGGSQKSWEGGELEAVKGALRSLRDDVNAAVKEGLLTLELGAVDDRMAELLPVLREAFRMAHDHFASAKRRARVLDFADLETHALRALRNEAARSHYQKRWKAFLVDEFQDTNPVQAELLRLLAGEHAIQTIVGDEKQSIYGFRRADVTVFRAFRERIEERGGKHLPLTVSFRSHADLIQSLNRIFAPVLKELHQDLHAERAAAPHPGPHIRTYVIRADKGVGKSQRQIAEARHIAALIKKMIDEGLSVYDKGSRALRPVRPGDFAILSRTWGPLDVCGEAIANCDIPVVHASGGNLLDTREAKDGWALLRFLADPFDSIALVGVLRSPFFAVNDRVLINVARTIPDGGSWWGVIKESAVAELAEAREVLGELLSARRFESPSRLLQLANRLTGYCAVIGNLPSAERREADWRGFFDLVLKMERGISDLSVLVRQLKRVAEAGGEVPRPPVEAQNAVSLMTIHGSKGLEWPVVIIPDLARERPNTKERMLFDSELGVAVRLEDESGEAQTPALLTLLEHSRSSRETEEARRVLYVALTRAQDHLILSSTEGEGGGLDLLVPGLDAADIYPETVWFDPEKDLPVCPPEPAALAAPFWSQTGTLGSGIFRLSVTALADYAQCPLRFKFRHVEGHPGLDEDSLISQRVGALMHKAIARNVREAEALARYDPTLSLDQVKEALDLAKRFFEDELFSAHIEQAESWNRAFTLKRKGITIEGVIDLVCRDFVVDYKADHEMWPQHHRFKVWTFAEASQKPAAHIAYVRHTRLHKFGAGELALIGDETEALIEGIVKGDYQAAPSYENCLHCSFESVCDQRHSVTSCEGFRT
jgi:ATP-dependent helicase/nuclease subunit A